MYLPLVIITFAEVISVLQIIVLYVTPLTLLFFYYYFIFFMAKDKKTTFGLAITL